MPTCRHEKSSRWRWSPIVKSLMALVLFTLNTFFSRLPLLYAFYAILRVDFAVDKSICYQFKPHWQHSNRNYSASEGLRQQTPCLGFAPEIHWVTSVPRSPTLGYHFRKRPAAPESISVKQSSQFKVVCTATCCRVPSIWWHVSATLFFLPQHIIFFKKYCVGQVCHNTLLFESQHIIVFKRKNNVLWQKKIRWHIHATIRVVSSLRFVLFSCGTVIKILHF